MCINLLAASAAMAIARFAGAAATAATPGAPIFGGNGFGTRGSERRAGPGWTNRHAQRVAKKTRNVARHRKACRA
jgi:hypothetical protein